MIIDQLTPTASDNLTDEVPVEQGTSTFKTTWQKILNLFIPNLKASSGTPAMDGTASRGSANTFSQSDHIHPTDTSRAAQSDMTMVQTDITNLQNNKADKNALYSPISSKAADYTLQSTDIGRTIFEGYVSGDHTMTFTLTQQVSTLFPVGAEIAFLRLYWASGVYIEFDGVRALKSGNASAVLSKTYSISEKNSLVAIKKIFADSDAGDAWLITGDVEEVTP